MTLFREPDEYKVGTVQGGLPTCTFSPKPYHRVISRLVLGNSVSSTATLYRGVLGSTPIGQTLLGASNSSNATIRIPAGQTFYVQWSAMGTLPDEAFARVTWMRDDNPLVAMGGDNASDWENDAITFLDVPTVHTDPEPYVHVGPINPALSQDAVIAYFWNPPNYAFVSSVEQSGSPDVGQWHMFAADVVNGMFLAQFIDMEYVISTGASEITIGQNVQTATLTSNENTEVTVADSGDPTAPWPLHLGSAFSDSGGVDVRMFDVSMPRGLRSRVDDTASSAAVGAETIVLTTPAMDFIEGRCYEVKWRGRTVSSVANTVTYQIRQTNLAGAIIATLGDIRLAGALTSTLFDTVYVRCDSGSFNDQLVLTLQASAGTGQMTGSATQLRWLEIRDCGAAADYANAFSI